jgi:hypothetical protein
LVIVDPVTAPVPCGLAGLERFFAIETDDWGSGDIGITVMAVILPYYTVIHGFGAGLLFGSFIRIRN